MVDDPLSAADKPENPSGSVEGPMVFEDQRSSRVSGLSAFYKRDFLIPLLHPPGMKHSPAPGRRPAVFSGLKSDDFRHSLPCSSFREQQSCRKQYKNKRIISPE
jgi:hypothetical protein